MLSILLIASMLPPSAFADEPADELTQETIDRVYDEVLSGEITSTEDVLRVALAQYEANQSTTYGMRSGGDPDTTDDEVPRITQVIETTQDEYGNTVLTIADTGILATDSTGETIVSDNLGNQAVKSFSEINIVAYHTVYYTYKHSELPLFETDDVLVYKQTTKLIANGSTLPTKLEHKYISVINGNSHCTFSQTFLYPSMNTIITSYPSGENVGWEPLDATTKPGFGSIAVIYCGSDTYEIGIDINPSTVESATITW